MKTQYWFKGVPVEGIEHVWVKVRENDEHRWYNYECSQDVNGYSYFPAIVVTWPLGDFIISNHCGVGINTLRKAKGGRIFEFEKNDVVGVFHKGEKEYFGKYINFDDNCYVESEYYRGLWEKAL